MTDVYAGAADWGGKDPAKCNRELYRLAMDTGTWTTLERGLPDEVEVRPSCFARAIPRWAEVSMEVWSGYARVGL